MPPRPEGPLFYEEPCAGSTFIHTDVQRRLRARPGDAIADALLNQRIVAGIGNVFKSEVLFGAGVDPFRAVATLSDEEVSRVLDEARRQLRANVLRRSQTLSPAFGRRTTRSLDPGEKLWVYGRGGRPCRNAERRSARRRPASTRD